MLKTKYLKTGKIYNFLFFIYKKDVCSDQQALPFISIFKGVSTKELNLPDQRFLSVTSRFLPSLPAQILPQSQARSDLHLDGEELCASLEAIKETRMWDRKILKNGVAGLY